MCGSGNGRKSRNASRLLSACVVPVATLAITSTAKAQVSYFWSGSQAGGGTVANPINGNWSGSTTANWYQDPNDVTSWGVGTAPANSDNTEIFLGGNSTHASYTSSENTAIDINSIYFEGTNPSVVDTLAFTLSGSSHTSLGTGTAAPVLQMDGSTSWALTSPGGATAPLRFNNSDSIVGAGSGNLDIIAEMANASSSGHNFTVNETGGGTIAFAAANVFGASGDAFTLTNGLVDFQNNQAFGVTTNDINLNGGTLESTTGNTVTGYTAINVGNIKFSGLGNWSLGSSPVNLVAAQTITADTAGTTGATIAGSLAGTSGLTVSSASTGILTLTNGNNAYTGATNFNGGTVYNNGKISASAVTVGSLGTLGGNGSFTLGATDNGILAPGATAGTIGTLNFLGGLSLTGSSAAYDDDINEAGSSDDLAVTGNLNLGLASTLNVNVLDSTSGGPYTIATYSGSLTGTFAGLNLPAGYGVSYGTGSNSAITLVVVPEPGSLAILSFAGMTLLRRRRRNA
jgi:fibronectin-binding autotransporter adhesin